MEGLSLFSIGYVLFSYVAVAVFVFGFVAKIYVYAKTPAPLKIPTNPSPKTKAGVAARLAGEVFFFTSLFKGNRWTWIGGYIFHVALLLILLRHLRYFLQPIPEPIVLVQQFGFWAGHIMPLAIIYLYIRRITVDRTRYISTLEDYALLVLFFAIGATGLMMNYLARADLIDVKEFILGLLTFSPVAFPDSPMFLVHFTLVLILMIIFPFSKLVHLGGLFFSPTRYQVDDPREHRHVNPWATQK